MEKKRLYIIAGVTGALGNALLSKLLQDKNTVVYGISRQARPWKDFIDSSTGRLYTKTFVCSLGDMEKNTVRGFVRAIDESSFSSIVYVHALGHFPFETDADGMHTVANDINQDGIDDMTYDLMYTKFTQFMDALRGYHARTHIPVAGTLFGSIADAHEPKVHQSWWRTMSQVKKYMQHHASMCGMHITNISSLLCAREVLSRPFVFVATDSDPRYWLEPHELAESLYAQFQSPHYYAGFDERNVFKHNPSFKKNYYSCKQFTKRKVRELYGTTAPNGVNAPSANL